MLDGPFGRESLLRSLCSMALVLSGCGAQEASPADPGTASGDAQAEAEAEAEASAPFEPAQRVLVIADDTETFHATLWAFERGAVGWTEAFSHPVTIGQTGLSWGTGLHDPSDIPPGDPIKHEGDGKSPMGLFSLTETWGYLPPAEVETLMPYATATESLICVDEGASDYYNRVIDWKAEGLNGGALPSHEDMLRSDELYRYTIFVAHNSPVPVPGGGSCIFLHLWGNSNDATIGCTAMAEGDMVRLLGWLDPSQSPSLAQLTRDNYVRVREGWELPEIVGLQ